MNAYQDAIDNSWQIYTDSIRVLGRRIFDLNVRPFCQKHGYEFTVASGEWWIGPPGCEVTKDTLILSSFNRCPSPELQPLHNLLSLWIPGMQCCLGSLMPGYKPTSNKADK